MSGGSMDYLYRKVEEAHFVRDTVDRRAFAAHLQLVAEALRAIEWVDSGDYAQGDENAFIRKCLQPGVMLAQATEDAKAALADLRAELYWAGERIEPDKSKEP